MCLSSSHSNTSTIQNYQKSGYSETKILGLEIHRTKYLITQHNVDTSFTEYSTKKKGIEKNSEWEFCEFSCLSV